MNYILICSFPLKILDVNPEELKVLQEIIAHYEKDRAVSIDIMEDK